LNLSKKYFEFYKCNNTKKEKSKVMNKIIIMYLDTECGSENRPGKKEGGGDIKMKKIV